MSPIDEIAAALREATTIGVVGHVGPDGDALGSALGLAHAARNAGKQAVASFGEPFVVPPNLAFLPTEPLVRPGDFPDDLDLMVVCDTATAERIGSLAPQAKGAKVLAVIDHHVSNDGFGDLRWVEPTAAATAEMVYQLLERVGWKVELDAAVCLYTGLVTDTGRFQYSATAPGTLRVAAALLEAGVRPEVVGQRVYEAVPFGYLTVLGAVTARAELDEDISLVSSIMYADDLDRAGVTYEDTDGLVDVVRLAKEAGVALLIKELEGRSKGSLRSRGQVDVSAIAQQFGGGGHHNAAGFTYDGTPEAAREAVRGFMRS